jgi:hypothetical protein
MNPDPYMVAISGAQRDYDSRKLEAQRKASRASMPKRKNTRKAPR